MKFRSYDFQSGCCSPLYLYKLALLLNNFLQQWNLLLSVVLRSLVFSLSPSRNSLLRLYDSSPSWQYGLFRLFCFLEDGHICPGFTSGIELAKTPVSNCSSCWTPSPQALSGIEGFICVVEAGDASNTYDVSFSIIRLCDGAEVSTPPGTFSSEDFDIVPTITELIYSLQIVF